VNKLKIIIVIAVSFLSGCASTQKAPENLDKYSANIRSTFVSYKSITGIHKAFAVAKYNGREFSSFTYSYPTKEEAEAKALSQCQERALKLRDGIKCYIYHSE